MERRAKPGFYLIADDALGGSFAINGGGLGKDHGNVYYFAPDSLNWEPCEFGFSEFLVWSLSGRLAGFYESLRWDGWEAEVQPLSGDRAISVYPFLWTSGARLAERSRRAISIAEQYDLQFDMQRQLDSR
jgi:hypothetical protein